MLWGTEYRFPEDVFACYKFAPKPYGSFVINKHEMSQTNWMELFKMGVLRLRMCHQV